VTRPALFSWFSPKTVKKKSALHGRGLFARRAIGKGEVVAVKGGHVYGRKTHDEVERTLGPVDVQIDDELFVGPLDEREVERSMLHLNHSCDPNLEVRGQIVFTARRPIRAGEELTFDYAMTDDEDFEMACACGTSLCRGTVTGRDWMRPDLQRRYRDGFSTFLLSKIRLAKIPRTEGGR
jgi:uncharacterized protein